MCELMALLSRPAFAGYPDEYLLARLRGRRAKQASERHSPTAAAGMTDAEAWDAMRSEFRWVYRQMNGGLRETFAPLFLWFELRTITLCLRFRRGGERGKAAGLLPASLLAKPVQQALTEDGEPAAVMEAVSGLLAAVAGPYRGLGAIYRERGGREHEQLLVTLYLERMTALPLHPVLREFFRSLIDMRNLVTLAKQLRWQLHEPQLFIRGGEITPERLGKALEEGNPAGLAALLAALPGMGAIPAGQENPEQQLFGWLTAKVRRLGRDPLGAGLVLDYLWRCFVEAHNLSILIHGEGLDNETLGAELIR
jgi:ATP synthase (C/AC39) subunit